MNNTFLIYYISSNNNIMEFITTSVTNKYNPITKNSVISAKIKKINPYTHKPVHIDLYEHIANENKELKHEIDIMRKTLLSIINLLERERNEIKYLKTLNDCYKLILSFYD